ncbi:PucR family transcriptional regulator [Streptomyces benahoarensis]|uniref:PucR family transcriptional regulator n=1 Tax=Streptomyces benahoarensis TaxID=2595054 RepID=A0A553ZFG8_9ACTN|nr:helix-turn-helix domain-containing protein [Streptomyces benahoarensis]TSB21331.1 PucR family transcriptional regulator [Streptomyces benahoarensis]TSB40211.1 PucR family transcriptional regulator [Streptomyces benahoarensis]
MPTIQYLLDELAHRLQRSATVDTPRGHLVASSRHYGDEDAPRIGVLLNRDLDERVAEYLYSFKIRSTEEKILIPARPELELKARCCYPLRRGHRLLGFLWLIDGDAPDDVVMPYVRQIAEALGEEAEAADDEARRLNELGQRLLRGGDEAEQAAHELREHGFASEGASVCLVAVVRPDQQRSVGLPALSTSAAVQEWRRPGREALEAVQRDVQVLLCGVRAGTDDGVQGMSSRLADELAGSRARIGVSEAGDVEDSRALLRQALLSACASQVFDHLPAAAAWADLYPERLLVETAATLPDGAQPPASMSPLFAPANAALLETVEAYLDHGGDRTATSEALFIHRSTLYYRLSQVQKLIGVDPTDGRSRLGLHLAVKLRRVLHSDVIAFLRNEEMLRR